MIASKRLKLVPIDSMYSKDLFDLWSDYDVIKYTYAPQLKTQAECDERVKLLIDNYTDWSCPNNFVVLLKDKAIGVAGFPAISSNNHEYGFFYHFIKKYWGNGYASEAATALIEYIFIKHPDAIVYADAVSINPASIAILTKLGFEQTHIDEKGFNRNGLELDVVHFKRKNKR